MSALFRTSSILRRRTGPSWPVASWSAASWRLSVFGAASAVVGAVIWIAVAIELVLAAWFGYYLL